MNILAFDTSSTQIAVCVKTDSSTVSVCVDAGMKHTEQLMDCVDFCVSRSGRERKDIELVACALGPGSFTGLRIGMATAKGLALALGKPWVAVPTLDCHAWGLDSFGGVVVPVIDGRKGRVYSAIYMRGKRSGDWLDIPAADLLRKVDGYSDVLFTGPDADLMAEYARERSGFGVFPRHRDPAAEAMCELARELFMAEGPAPENLGPLYLRPSEAEESSLR